MALNNKSYMGGKDIMQLRCRVGAVVTLELKQGLPIKVGRIVQVTDDEVVICCQRPAQKKGVSPFNQGNFTVDTPKHFAIERNMIGAWSYATPAEATKWCNLDVYFFEDNDYDFNVYHASNVISSYDNNNQCEGNGESCYIRQHN